MLRPHFPRDCQHSLSPCIESQQVSELALLIDAIPVEYREDVLLAVLQVGTDDVLQKSHFVSLCRERLRECLAARTGTICNFKKLRQFDLTAVRQRIGALATAADPAEAMIALSELLRFLIEALRLTGHHLVSMPNRRRVISV